MGGVILQERVNDESVRLTRTFLDAEQTSLT
jgi:hypothetical protein